MKLYRLRIGRLILQYGLLIFARFWMKSLEWVEPLPSSSSIRERQVALLPIQNYEFKIQKKEIFEFLILNFEF